MSDAAYDVALGVLRGFTMGEEVGSQALAVVESQNQALQERAEKAEARKDVWHERFEAVAEEVRALQERAERAERERDAAKQLLDQKTYERVAAQIADRTRPTQETDPE